jgi:hypothetical protein
LIVKVKIEVVSFETESGRKRTIGVVKFDVNDANSLVRGHMWYLFYHSRMLNTGNTYIDVLPKKSLAIP